MPWTLDDELARARGRGESPTLRAPVELVAGTGTLLRTQTLPSPTDPGTLEDEPVSASEGGPMGGELWRSLRASHIFFFVVAAAAP